MRRRVSALKFRNKRMETLPDHVLVAHVFPHVSARSLGDVCRLSEVSKRFRRLLVETLSSNGRIVRQVAPDTRETMRLAVLEGSWDLVFYCVRMADLVELNWGMRRAAEGGHLGMVEYFVSQGARDWCWGMYGAVDGGHRRLVDYFLSRGADEGMNYAARRGHLDLVEYFASKGSTDWNTGMNFAALGGHRELVDYFVSKGVTDWRSGGISAMRGGHYDLVDYFRNKITH